MTRAAVLILLLRAVLGNALQRRPLRLLNLLGSGRVRYADAWDLQHALMEHHILEQERDEAHAKRTCGTVVILEHAPVYTLGTATKEGSGPFTNVLPDGSKLEFELFNVERAGEATYHGPGQLVVYPILDLTFFDRDIDKYLRSLEQIVIESLEQAGVSSPGRIHGLTGVWVGDQKLAAIGIKLRRWVTMHGVSVNVCPDMRYFANIVPCGIRDKGVGSLIGLTGDSGMTVTRFADIFIKNFKLQFDVNFEDEIYEGQQAIEFVKNLR